MDHQLIIKKISENKNTFQELLNVQSREEVRWKPAPEKWCLLEIACHLRDEETEDFLSRVRHVLSTPDQPLPPIDPLSWVTSRKYLEQDYAVAVENFLEERSRSCNWLLSLKNPPWKNAYLHPKFGAMSAEMFLANWLAHDYLHFRQITSLKYQYLKFHSGESLTYAGEW